MVRIFPNAESCLRLDRTLTIERPRGLARGSSLHEHGSAEGTQEGGTTPSGLTMLGPTKGMGPPLSAAARPLRFSVRRATAAPRGRLNRTHDHLLNLSHRTCREFCSLPDVPCAACSPGRHFTSNFRSNLAGMPLLFSWAPITRPSRGFSPNPSTGFTAHGKTAAPNGAASVCSLREEEYDERDQHIARQRLTQSTEVDSGCGFLGLERHSGTRFLYVEERVSNLRASPLPLHSTHFSTLTDAMVRILTLKFGAECVFWRIS